MAQLETLDGASVSLHSSAVCVLLPPPKALYEAPFHKRRYTCVMRTSSKINRPSLA